MNNVDFSQSGGQKITNTITLTLLQQAWADGFKVLAGLLASAGNGVANVRFGGDTHQDGSNLYIDNAGVMLLNGEPFLVSPLEVAGAGTLYYKIADVYASTDPVTFFDGSKHSVHHLRTITLFGGTPPAGTIGVTYFLASGIQTIAQALLNTINGGSPPNSWINIPSFGTNWADSGSVDYPVSSYLLEKTLLGSNFLGRISMQGVVLSSAAVASSEVTLFTLPVGKRPKKIKQFICGGTKAWKVYVDSLGNVVLDNGDGTFNYSSDDIDLSAISFLAEQ